MSSLMSPMIQIRRHGRGRLAHEEGVALVEFALVLPFLLLIIFAMVDVGRAISYWNDETHLASEAARYAVVNKSPVPGQTIEQAIKDQAVTDELRNGSSGDGTVETPGLTVSICFPSGTGQIGEPVKVTVKATYKWLAYLGLDVATSPMTGTSEQRIEKPFKGDSTDAYTPVACP
jgi:Flp pilus assembly protein TadG